MVGSNTYAAGGNFIPAGHTPSYFSGVSLILPVHLYLPAYQKSRYCSTSPPASSNAATRASNSVSHWLKKRCACAYVIASSKLLGVWWKGLLIVVTVLVLLSVNLREMVGPRLVREIPTHCHTPQNPVS